MQARREGTARTVADSPPVALSPWSPFRHTTFTVLWTATVIANIGTWMYNAASGWLMTRLNADPFMVSLVQVATSLPMFLFAVPAGALADAKEIMCRAPPLRHPLRLSVPAIDDPRNVEFRRWYGNSP